MTKKIDLNAIEMQYLRLSLGLTTTQVASLTSQDEAAVLAWENGSVEVPAQAQKQLLDIDDVIEMQVLNTCDGIEALFKKEPKRQLTFVVYPTQALYTQYNPDFLSTLPLTELYNVSAWRIKKECKLVLDVDISLITFDADSYKTFRAENGLGESRDNRAKWAATQLA